MGKLITYSGMLMWEFSEFAGTGYHVEDMQMMQTDESQLMMSCGSRTSHLHKSIAQTNGTK